MKSKLAKARDKLNEALHILKIKVIKDVKEAIGDIYQAIDYYEQNNERKCEREKRRCIGSAGQWIAALFCSWGIGIELCMHADMGYVLITLGSFLFAVSTKVKYYSRRR